MAKRDLSLSNRDSQDRKLRTPPVPVHFTIAEISDRFGRGIDSVHEQIAIAKRLMSEGNVEACESILRSQVVQSESLLDFFLHEVTKYCLFQMFAGRWEKTEQYGKLTMTLARAEEGIRAGNSEDWFFRYVNDRFSWKVMLSPNNISDQLRLLGFRPADIYEDAFPDVGGSEDRKRIVSGLFDRRNAIAHQDDRSHETAGRNPIDAQYVERCASYVLRLGEAISRAVRERELGLDDGDSC